MNLKKYRKIQTQRFSKWFGEELSICFIPWILFIRISNETQHPTYPDAPQAVNFFWSTDIIYKMAKALLILSLLACLLIMVVVNAKPTEWVGKRHLTSLWRTCYILLTNIIFLHNFSAVLQCFAVSGLLILQQNIPITLIFGKNRPGKKFTIMKNLYYFIEIIIKSHTYNFSRKKHPQNNRSIFFPWFKYSRD